MGAQPTVSIVTIVYNGEKYLEHAITSVLQQSYQPIEYIIIDGGSTDNTISIIKKYQDKLAYWVSEKDKGISDAFNKGITRATGNIIGILNSDDWYESDTVQKVVQVMDEGDVVYGDVQYWKNERKSFMQKGAAEHLEEEVSVLHPTVFVKKTCYHRHGGFDLQYRCAMDYELLLRLKLKGCRFVYVPEVLTNMRWEGFSDKKWLLGCKETLAIKNRYFPARKPANKRYFYKTVFAISLFKTLERFGMGFLVRFYRHRFSRLKKRYN